MRIETGRHSRGKGKDDIKAGQKGVDEINWEIVRHSVSRCELQRASGYPGTRAEHKHKKRLRSFILLEVPDSATRFRDDERVEISVVCRKFIHVAAVEMFRHGNP